MSELKSFGLLLEQVSEARFDCGLLINTNKDGYNKAAEKADQLEAELITAWNTRKPEPGQPADFIEVDGIHVNAQWVRDIRGKLADTDYKLQWLEAKQPAAGQSEPVAEKKEYAYAVEETSYGAMLFFDEKEAYSYCADDEHPVKLYTHPIPAAPAVPEGWKLVPIKPTEAMLAAGECSGMCGDGRVVAVEFIIDAETVAEIYSNVIAASPNQQGGAG